MGGCVVDAGACFAQAQCDLSPCTITNASTGARYISFTDTATDHYITFPCSITLQVLVVAGGGAGGSALGANGGGGGGAGGLAFGNVTFTANTPYQVVVGPGAPAPPTSSIAPPFTYIQNSTLGVMIVIGGGNGASYKPDGITSTRPAAGGSGGGGNRRYPVGGASSPGFGPQFTFTFNGSRGGDNDNTGSCSGAGGGGAGTAGEARGGGGQGYLWHVTNLTYAVGGGGGCQTTVSAGQPNTGNGGQGAPGGSSGSQDGAAGEGGIVILALT